LVIREGCGRATHYLSKCRDYATCGHNLRLHGEVS
jgi:hypothetical protein